MCPRVGSSFARRWYARRVKFKVIKNGSCTRMLELTGSTGVWNDASLGAFLGKKDRGWPEKFASCDGVYFQWSEGVTHFAGFGALPNIKRLWGVGGAFALLDGLEECTKLEIASFPSSDKITVKTLAPLTGMKHIEKLSLRGFKHLADIDAIATMTSLRVLSAGYVDKMKSLEPIGAVKNLEALSLYGADLTKLPLAPLAGLEKLRFLDLTCRGLGDLTPLAKLPKLETIRVYGWEEKDLEKMTSYAALKSKLTNGQNGVADCDDGVFACDE
jgi:hypothetical protein